MEIKENCIINGMPEKVYHADPCVTPSFSSSMAIDLVEMTPEEAMIGSRRLNPNFKEGKSTDASDMGTMAHDFILCGGSSKFEIAPFEDWRTKDARTVKADIESRGKIALNNSTSEKLRTLETMKDALFSYLSKHDQYPDIMLKGKAEQSGFAFDGEIWNRARFDFLPEGRPEVIVDYKTTALTFDRWEKSELWDNGKVLQDLHYSKTYNLITENKHEVDFIFVVQRTVEPFHTRIIKFDGSYWYEVKERYEESRAAFIHGLTTGEWPGQHPDTYHSCPPPWVLQKWEMQRAIRANAAANKEAKPQFEDNRMAG